MSDTKGTRLFDPPTARDCVEAAVNVASARAIALDYARAMHAAGASVAGEDLDRCASLLGLVPDLFAAIAGDGEVGATK